MGDFPPGSTFASLVFPTTGSDSDEPNNFKADLAKTVIEWLFVVIALILIAYFFLRKIFGPRTSQHRDEMLHIPDSVYRREQSSFALPSLLDYPASMCDYATCPTLAYPLPVYSHPASASARLPVHSASHRVRAVTPPHMTPSVRGTSMPIRALDIGEGGRRLTEDAELVLSDGDVLPAYDGRDRPPKYAMSMLAMGVGPGVGVVNGGGAGNADVVHSSPAAQTDEVTSSISALQPM
ncbi:hypothetical protein MSAN_00474400 [Mycena sanguinolenta]|uniref:Uncharacterized protein n=1 Tax=Mycena sanguinolenta TaxID=230812 RepID=A0A8H6ZEG9_9AGAR|nr:hypothetical protein MSAN_00474400 [Mycena sanguinolenta]